jgi:hypothetical protein
MKPKGYLLFHLNLAFSSIEEDSRADVIRDCYHPLLDLIEKTGVPAGVELTGWSLKQIERIDFSWIVRFKKLLESNGCELIGSGYCQIIGPLVPHNVNEWNQKLGLHEYTRILGVQPRIALVNEMAYSDSLVDLYAKFGYSGLIMDRDNIRLALGHVDKFPTHARGNGNFLLPVLWSDSILFQKVQHYAHGEIPLSEYINYINWRIGEGDTLLPIYSNDVEIFGYRPGRFSEERPKHPDGEWFRVNNLLVALSDEVGMEWVSPSEAINLNSQKSSSKITLQLSSGAYPVPVKKQAKYNIARWAVTGRDDTWLNTMCYRIYKKLDSLASADFGDWQNLCELWASDFRTHITEKRWSAAKDKVENTLKKLELSDHYGINANKSWNFIRFQDHESVGGFTCRVFGEGIYLALESEKINIVLNLRRGLAIDSLSFLSHGTEACIVTLKHGQLDSILQGVDYYSGGIVIEVPELKTKITDLVPVEPCYLVDENGDLVLRASFETHIGNFTKYVTLSGVSEQVKVTYHMSEMMRYISSARVGNFTLSPKFSRLFQSYSCYTGGAEQSSLPVMGVIDQSKSASSFVSSSRGFSATTGELVLECSKNRIFMTWDPSNCSPLCFIDHQDDFTRVSFSICEVDESSKESDRYGDFEVVLSSSTL